MTLFERLKRNPVLIGGFVASLLVAVIEAAVANGVTVAPLVVVLASVLTRLFTVPFSEVVPLDGLDLVDLIELSDIEPE